ncbi:MPP9 phase, partial [Indicator maculatus]|nr:MPP9 phase [Indicator maculatus]
SPSSNPHGVSGYSGNTRSSLMPGSVELLASFMQDIQNIGSADSEILKNCETRWLQLLRLVEKQCQEQIVAQQQQFHHQIQLVQDEIRQLVKLQTSNWGAGKSRSLPAKLADTSSPERQMGMRSELFEENECIVNQLRSHEAESQPNASDLHQECLAKDASMSSGYDTLGTLSASELNPSKSHSISKCTACMEKTSQGQSDAAVLQSDAVVASIQNQVELFTPKIEENYLSGRNDILDLAAESEHKVDEAQRGKKASTCVYFLPSSKSLTSWAQKLKQNQPKRINAEEVCVNSMQENEQARKLPLGNTNPTDAALPPYAFYLNQPNKSPNSLVSEASGLSYWKFDEKEMYHSLPSNFRSEFTDAFSTKVSSADEAKLSSLKDIYHKRQRENKQQPDQDFMPPSQSSHPPEILTLDPTLHMKPGQQNPGRCFFSLPEDSTPFSPDSMAEPGFSSHCDTDSFSQTSSSQLDDSPKHPASSRAVQLDLWGNHPFQNENKSSCPFPMAYTDASNGTLVSTEEEEARTLTPSSVTQCADNSLPEYSLSGTSVEDPVIMSKIRQNLREKHARHIADLRAYYDSEIHSLKQQLEASHKTSSSEDLKKINQNLADRCDQLDAALNEASARIKALENKNNMLEKQVADWRERFCAVSNTSKVLQERIEEMRTSNKDKDNTISRLKSRLQDLEEAFEKAYKLSDNKNTRLKEENKMFQNLLGEYESLGKEHERVKDTLNTTENKLLDANTQISDLKRTISKLEAQLKQVEHENALKLRHITESHLRTSCATFFSSPSKLPTPDVSRRKWLIPGAEYSIFTGQPLEVQESPKDNRLEETYIPPRYHSPPEKDSSQEDSSTNTTGKETEMSEAPIIKAFKELEQAKAFKDWGTQTEKEDASAKTSNRRQTVGFVETSLVVNRSPDKGREQHRPKRYSPPSGQRSSSLPPSNRKANTPTRREIMLAPVSVTYSPKRSPKENLSPGFSHLLSRNENTVTRFDILLDDLEAGPTSTLQHNNPRKRLQFLSLDDVEGVRHSSGAESTNAGMKKVTAWDDRSIAQKHEPVLSPCEGDFKYTARIKTLAETERLFDELTQEKQQAKITFIIEAALSRIPCSGGRMTLQARLNQEALEDRLERINRDLGSIRMILKRFHVLRTSANL